MNEKDNYFWYNTDQRILDNIDRIHAVCQHVSDDGLEYLDKKGLANLILNIIENKIH